MLRFALVLVALLTIACSQSGAPGDGGPQADPTKPPPPPSLLHGFQIDFGHDYERALKLTREAGFGRVKLQVRWVDMEPTKGKIDWTYLDKVVDTANKQGVQIMMSVTAAPLWSRPSGSTAATDGPPSDPKLFADFLTSLATRYKGKVTAYEIWNEQNSNREWAGPTGVSAKEYVALLKVSHAAVKAADPSALVVTGAPTPAGDVPGGSRDDVAYFREMYEAGMKGYFDAVGVHASGFNNAPELDPADNAVLTRSGQFHNHRSFYFRNFEFYRKIMEEQGDAAKPLWFTEFGWASGDAASEWGYAKEISEQAQADYLVKAFQIGKERGYVGAMFVWNLNFFDYDFAKRAFAVLKPDWSARSSYKALAAMPK